MTAELVVCDTTRVLSQDGMVCPGSVPITTPAPLNETVTFRSAGVSVVSPFSVTEPGETLME